MKKLIPLLLLISSSIPLLNCHSKNEQKSAFKEFDFSFSNTFETSFSIKFTQGDTVFIREHWASLFENPLKSKTNYVGVVNHSDRVKVDSLLIATNLCSYDTICYKDYADGGYYQYYIWNKNCRKTIYIHCSSRAPKKLYDLATWLYDLKQGLQLKEIDTTLTFVGIEHFLPPVPSGIDHIFPPD